MLTETDGEFFFSPSPSPSLSFCVFLPPPLPPPFLRPGFLLIFPPTVNALPISQKMLFKTLSSLEKGGGEGRRGLLKLAKGLFSAANGRPTTPQEKEGRKRFHLFFSPPFLFHSYRDVFPPYSVQLFFFLFNLFKATLPILRKRARELERVGESELERFFFLF